MLDLLFCELTNPLLARSGVRSSPAGWVKFLFTVLADWVFRSCFQVIFCQFCLLAAWKDLNSNFFNNFLTKIFSNSSTVCNFDFQTRALIYQNALGCTRAAGGSRADWAGVSQTAPPPSESAGLTLRKFASQSEAEVNRKTRTWRKLWN
jgi:hypothetical protein